MDETYNEQVCCINPPVETIIKTNMPSNPNDSIVKRKPIGLAIDNESFEKVNKHRRSSVPTTPSAPDIVITSAMNGGNDSSSEHEQRRPRARSSSVQVASEVSNIELREELIAARHELERRIAKNEELERVQEQMNGEVTELTASLFEQANKMVQEANVKRMQTENELKAANNKIEMLQAEVSALKALVITSTPATPNKHLHPQLDASAQASQKQATPNKFAKKSGFVKTHRRSTSHHQFTRDEMSAVNINLIKPSSEANREQNANEENRNNEDWGIDPVYFDEFNNWKKSPKLDDRNTFLGRIADEDILPCLDFANNKLSQNIHWVCYYL
ncbi:DgyrCDS6529 [Dimorphilus gyrociliatus]|uniref:DgyrCDS6529 n=1 Tax=Dimorphilus gyrociliatus TaxID=2664684 RepID=A0A7I8VPW6_9ANNE|nr:DgyrCDS6529 [Dimorphilus gyrociliatus]